MILAEKVFSLGYIEQRYLLLFNLAWSWKPIYLEFETDADGI